MAKRKNHPKATKRQESAQGAQDPSPGDATGQERHAPTEEVTALREATLLSEAIVDTVREPLLVLDQDLRVVRANRSFHERFKVEPSETGGRRIYELGNRQWDIPRLRELLEQVLEDQPFSAFEVEHDFEGIGRRTMLLNARHIAKLGMILLAIEDITDRKSALKDRDRLEHILKSIADGFVFLDHEFRCSYVNPSAAEMLGGKPEDLLGKQIWEAFPRTAGTAFHSELQRAMSERVDVRIEEYYPPDDRWYSFRCYPSEAGLSLFVVDISYRKRAEEAQEELAAIVEHINDAVIRKDLDGTITHWNKGAERMYGYTAEEAIGENIRMLFPDGAAGRVADIFDQLRRGGHIENHETARVRKEGTTIEVSLTISPIRDSRGQVISACAIARDISELKRHERALEKLNDSLEEHVADRIELMSILRDVAIAANEAETVEKAMQAALERICDYNRWVAGHVYRLADDDRDSLVSSRIWHVNADLAKPGAKLEKFQQESARLRFSRGQGLIGRVLETGEPQWIDEVSEFEDWQRSDPESHGLRAAIAFPAKVEDDVVAVLEFLSDRPVRREKRFMEIMENVGIELGHVIERYRLQKAVASATAEQQRHLSRELHDSVSQELTGVSVMAETLRQELAEAASPCTKKAVSLVDHLQGVHEQLRRLSRGLMPVDVDAEGLMNALDTLAADVKLMYGIACDFRCPDRVTVENNEVATQLYRIGQEAIQNAVRHGQPSRIVISLLLDGNSVILIVEDNGGGFKPQTPPSRGVGRRLMQYRANLIGAKLNVQSRDGQGVTVTCELSPD